MQTVIDSNTFNVTLDGLDGVHHFLHEIEPAIRKTIKKNLTNVGFLVQREARRRCPYKEGNLERSIKFNVGEAGVRVYVPINSAAGMYALQKHDGVYRLGEASRAKGSQVGPKYITRAINENTQKITSLAGAGLATI